MDAVPGCSKEKSDPDSNSDSDPIVDEIPIYHSTRLQDKLYHFEYPLIPNDGKEKIIERCLFKSNQEQMRLEIGINVESPNFDQDRAEIMAQEIDGENADYDKKMFKNSLVDRVFFKSTKSIDNPHKYAAMVFNGKEIHLTTLKGMLQFWPTFPHLNKKDGKRKGGGSDDILSEDETDVAGPSKVEQVTVKMRKNDDRWKKSRTTSNLKNLQANEAEEYVECQWHDCDSIISNVEKSKLFAENLEETGQAANLSLEEYLRVLVPEGKEHEIVTPTLPSHMLSLHALRALPLQEQCRLLLKDAQIIQFQQLLMLLAGGDGLTPEILLKTLPKVAVLVRGNWVVKSDVLYPPESFSATSGVPAELMCRARDYVLYLFTKNQYVERKKISSVMKIPSEEVKEIFTGISRLSHNKGWELLLNTDQDFIGKHTEMVQRQTFLWEQRYQQLTNFLKDTKRQRRKSRSITDDKTKNCSDNDSGTEKNKSPVFSRKRNLSQTIT